MFKRAKRRRTFGAAVTDRVPVEGPVPPSRQNRIFFITALLVVLFVGVLLFRPFLVAVTTGLLVAYLSRPLYRLIQRALRLRALSAFVALLLVLAIIVFPLAAIGFVLVDEATELAAGIATSEPPPFLEHALDFYIQMTVDDPENETLVQQEKDAFTQSLLRRASTVLAGYIPEVIELVGGFLIGLFIVAFVMFYVFVDGEGLLSFLRRTLPLPPHQTDFLLAETASAIDAIFIGQIASALLQGFVGGLGFWIFGVQNPVFWGAVMAVLSLLPVVGAFLVWAPAGFVLVAQGQTADGIMLLIWGAVLVSNVDNVAKPLLIGDRADIHPVFVLIGVLGGISVFGVIGFVLGPLILGVATAFLKVWNAEYHDQTGWVRRPPPADAPGPTSPPTAVPSS